MGILLFHKNTIPEHSIRACGSSAKIMDISDSEDRNKAKQRAAARKSLVDPSRAETIEHHIFQILDTPEKKK